MCERVLGRLSAAHPAACPSFLHDLGWVRTRRDLRASIIHANSTLFLFCWSRPTSIVPRCHDLACCVRGSTAQLQTARVGLAPRQRWQRGISLFASARQHRLSATRVLCLKADRAPTFVVQHDVGRSKQKHRGATFSIPLLHGQASVVCPRTCRRRKRRSW